MRLACMRSPRPTRAAPPAPRPDAAAPVVRRRVRYKLVEAAKLEDAKPAFESVTCHVYRVHAARPSSGEAMWSLNHQQDRGLYAKVPAAASPPALTVPRRARACRATQPRACPLCAARARDELLDRQPVERGQVPAGRAAQGRQEAAAARASHGRRGEP